MKDAPKKQNDVEKMLIVEEKTLDSALRPSIWEEYIGQESIKENLQILLKAAKGRNHHPEHILFYGPPGLGKTTLANLVAKESGSKLRTTSGPAIEKVGDIAAILTNLTPGEMLFIDEIHRLNKTIEEVLYPAMESGTLDIILGKGPSARTIQLELPPFTLLGATTKIGMISAPLRSRFGGGVFRLEFYKEKEIEKIIERSAKILKIECQKDALSEIAKRSRFTPRTANYLLKRCRDFSEVKKRKMDKNTVKDALSIIGVDEWGLFPADRDILKTLIEKFRGGPVGLSTLSASLSEEISTIEDVHEPYLMQIGLLERTPKGRVATKKAFDIFEINTKNKLFKN